MQELLVSLETFLARGDRTAMDLGAPWARKVRNRLSTGLRERLMHPCHVWVGMLHLLTLQPDAPPTPEAFRAWMTGLSAGALFERDAALGGGELRGLGSEVAALRDETAALVHDWNEQYFRHVDGAILDGLAAEAERLRRVLPFESPIDLIERVTAGVRFVPVNPPDRVLLIPQYHYRPWNIHGRFGGLQLFRYPADVVPPAPGEPPIELLRATRALGDESRLRILRHLAGRSHSFTDLVRLVGLSKSTVHHHLVTLRAAGLVRLEHRDEKTTVYSLRPDMARDIGERLDRFLLEGG